MLLDLRVFVVAAVIWMATGDRRAVDQARVNLGMARGNAKMGQYMNVISYDIASLLQVRVPRRVKPTPPPLTTTTHTPLITSQLRHSTSVHVAHCLVTAMWLLWQWKNNRIAFDGQYRGK